MQDSTKTLDKHVGNKIKERRKALGLTQSDLADIIGLSCQQVQRYESGENTVTVSRLLEIANGLNVQPKFFYEGAPVSRGIGQKISAGLITKDHTRPLKILLVEDSSTDELLFRKAVEKCAVPAVVRTIQNPESVIDFLMERAGKDNPEFPDIVILDINMPRLNGIALLQRIKSANRLKTLPIVMLTNSIRSKDMLEAYTNHANGFVQKNSDLLAFYEDVSRILDYWCRTIVLPSAA